MKRKLKLMLFIMICMYTTVHSQSLSLTGPTTVNSGEAFTLTVANETASQYLGSMPFPWIDYDNPPNNASFVLANFTKSTYFDPAHPTTTGPSKFEYNLTNSYALPIKVKLTFAHVIIANSVNPGAVDAQLVYTITVNPASPGFRNTARTGVFYKNDCGVGYTSDPYTYTVPEGKHIAQSQKEADDAAQLDLLNNGQNLANANRTCIVQPVTISGPTSGWRNQDYTYQVLNTFPGDSYTWSITNGATIISGQGTSQISTLFKDIAGTAPYSFVISVSVSRSGVPTRTASFSVTSKFCANCPK